MRTSLTPNCLYFRMMDPAVSTHVFCLLVLGWFFFWVRDSQPVDRDHQKDTYFPWSREGRHGSVAKLKLRNSNRNKFTVGGSYGCGPQVENGCSTWRLENHFSNCGPGTPGSLRPCRDYKWLKTTFIKHDDVICFFYYSCHLVCMWHNFPEAPHSEWGPSRLNTQANLRPQLLSPPGVKHSGKRCIWVLGLEKWLSH